MLLWLDSAIEGVTPLGPSEGEGATLTTPATEDGAIKADETEVEGDSLTPRTATATGGEETEAEGQWRAPNILFSKLLIYKIA